MSATSPMKDLEEAGATLARAEALIGRAAIELGPPFREPLEMRAADVASLRRRLRNATTTATATGSNG